MSFDQAAVNTLFDDVVSAAMTLAIFDTVNGFEPKSAPGNGITAAVWIQDIRPVGAASGLAATSGVVTLNIRIYGSFLQQPPDAIDPNLMTAATTLLGTYTGMFTFDDSVRNIDLLGTYGQSMSAVAGYLTQDSKIFRIMTVTLPVVINDLWVQEA